MISHRLSRWTSSFLLSALTAATAPAENGQPVYQNSFNLAPVGKVPEDFLVLMGAFTVKEEAGNKFLALPGAPLDTFGVIFGPTELDGFSVSARIFATSKGRRYPTFSVGLNGVGGVKLQVTPAKKQIELLGGDVVIASAAHQWESGTWTWLRLSVAKAADDEYLVRGKVWAQDATEPKEWSITHLYRGKLFAGRASVWGQPYSGTPIHFDDLSITPIQ